jgi:hypothetical protein
MEILKSKYNNKELDEKERLEELKAKLFLLETENEKLNLTNKMNNEIIAQLETKNLNNIENNINDKDKIIDTDPSTSNNNFNNEILNYGKDQQVKLLKNLRKTVDNIRSFVKIKQEKDFKIDFI